MIELNLRAAWIGIALGPLSGTVHGLFASRDEWLVSRNSWRRHRRSAPRRAGLPDTGTVISLYRLKPGFQALLRRPAAALARAGITANEVTIAAVGLSVGYGLLLAFDPVSRALLLALPAMLLLRMALNAIDGMLAREHGMKSPCGALLNEIADVTADAAFYLPFALLPGVRPAIIVALVLLAVISEMAGVLGQVIGASRRYDGPLGKSDRAFLFGAVALALGLGAPAGAWLDWMLGCAAAATAITVVNRLRGALREIGSART